jgi:putative ABC transport system ATP-binding protein
MGNTLIQISNMSKRYKIGGEVVHALNNVSLTINKGDFIAIIGPSGSGKSTFMNMIGCLDKADEGAYILDDRDVNSLNDSQLASIRNEKIGFIFQNFNLLTKITAIENVELPLIYRGMKKKQRRLVATSYMTDVGLENRLDQFPNQLSGGQQQRVAIARALAGQPEILLADEPTGALDQKTGREILTLMKNLNSKGHTIILITHDEKVASEAKRVVRIEDGQLFETRGETVEHYAVSNNGVKEYQRK